MAARGAGGGWLKAQAGGGWGLDIDAKLDAKLHTAVKGEPRGQQRQ